MLVPSPDTAYCPIHLPAGYPVLQEQVGQLCAKFIDAARGEGPETGGSGGPFTVGGDGGPGRVGRRGSQSSVLYVFFAISFKRIGVLHVRIGKAPGSFMCSVIVYLSFSPQVHLLIKKFPETRPYLLFPDSS